jgi:hypothetical protein
MIRPLSLALALATAAHAAPPDATWRTVETEHFRLHYPTEAEAWALAAAGRLEAMRARVAGEVGFGLDRKVEVVVRDPYATANGMVLPFARRPHMELWVSPPPADSPIGWNRRWDEGLIVHEDTHAVHLAARSRGGLDALVTAITGFGPITLKAPRWVIEGYATVVEGDLTGYGRPFSASLAAELRKLAREGALPTYDELDGSPRWAGGGYAYGIGSAYLRWLRAKHGEDSLRKLWIRMTAVESRSFEEAFEGLFGDSPSRLYGRFCAELTLAAMQAEEVPFGEDPTRFLDFDGSTGAPAVSPDGGRIVLVAGKPKRRLQVWPTTFDAEKAAEERQEAVDALLEADPVDIPDVVPPEPPLEREHARTRLDRAPSSPRWIDDATVLFVGLAPDRTGRVRTDLYAWTPETGEERRITRGADLREADPAPDGTFAIAIRQTWGASGLVRVDLADGSWTELEPPSIDKVYDHPRVSPDGARVAYLAMQDGRWELYVRPLDGPATRIPTPDGANLATPSWHPAGDRLLVSMGTPDWLDIVEIPLEGGEPRRLTRSHGGVFAPDARGGHLFWIDEDADGRDVHRADLPERGDPLPPPLPPSLATAPPPPVVPLPEVVAVTSTPYGLGRTAGRALLSGATSRGDHRVELVARYGDIVGRHELLVAVGGGFTSGATPRLSDGARAALALRSLPVDLHVDAFAHRAIAGAGLVGGAVAFTDTHRFASGALTGGGGAGVGVGVDGQDRHLGFGDLRLQVGDRAHRLARFDGAVRAAGGAVDGGTGGWVRADAQLDLFRDYLGIGVGVGSALGDAAPLVLGGVRDATLPDAWQLGRILRPAFAPLAGRDHLATSLRLGPGAGLLVERHVLGDGFDLTRGATFLGVDGRTEFERTPIGKIPAGVVESGIGCRLETPSDGIRRRPCTRLDDWTAWASVTWRR